MNIYKCIIIIKGTVSAETDDQAKEIMCNVKIKKEDVIVEKEAVGYI